jgi:enoyl-[acyl-carrier protein] reductase II
MDGGADAVRIGTRFVVTTESDAHPDYVKRLVEARGPDDTELTTQFNEGWPDAPHRVLRSALVEARNKDFHEVSPPSTAEDGPVDFRALYAGCGVGEIHSVVSAAEVVDELMSLLK